jgi:hypothetical protein
VSRSLLAAVRTWAWALGAAGAAISPPARGDDSVATQCIAAAEQSQPLRRDGKLKAAREELVACSRSVCPSVVRSDCTKWLVDLDALMPSVVFRAVDAAGVDLRDVRVLVDGQQVAQSLDGKEIEIDPGVHALRFEHAESAPIDQQVVVRTAERHRIVSATFAAAPAASLTPPPSSPEHSAGSKRSVVFPITLIAAGAAGVGLASYFWLSGLGDRSTMASGCAPTHACAPSAVDSARGKLVIGDVSGGIGIAAAALGAGFLVFGQGQRPAASGAVVGVRSLAGGGAIDVITRF